MKPVHKGRKGEQEIGRWLYKAWFGKEPTPDRQVFIRTGFGRKQLSDIVLPPDFPYQAVEVKNREVPLNQILDNCGEFIKWIEALPPYSLLFFKVKRRWFVVSITPATKPLIHPFYHVDIGACRVSLMTLNQLERELAFYKNLMQSRDTSTDGSQKNLGNS